MNEIISKDVVYVKIGFSQDIRPKVLGFNGDATISDIRTIEREFILFESYEPLRLHPRVYAVSGLRDYNVAEDKPQLTFVLQTDDTNRKFYAKLTNSAISKTCQINAQIHHMHFAPDEHGLGLSVDIPDFGFVKFVLRADGNMHMRIDADDSDLSIDGKDVILS